MGAAQETCRGVHEAWREAVGAPGSCCGFGGWEAGSSTRVHFRVRHARVLLVVLVLMPLLYIGVGKKTEENGETQTTATTLAQLWGLGSRV